MRLLALTAAALMAGQAALAAGEALVIGNGADATRLFGAARIDRAADALRRQGVRVTEAADADAQAMQEAFSDFLDGIDPEDGPILVVLAGDFAHGAGGAWFLPADPGSPAEVMTQALSLGAVLSVLAAHPGRAALVLGEAEADGASGPWLSPGSGALTVPQGVTVIRGPQADILRFVPRALALPGERIAEAARDYELELLGYAPEGFVLLRAADTAPPVPGRVEDAQADAERVAAERRAAQRAEEERQAADDAAWALAQGADTASGYRTYLEGFPEGSRAAAARQRLAAIEADPYYAARRTEERLELSREARRTIQRNLSILGHDTRGIDGIFGQGTRAAIAEWQRAEGLPPSTWLDTPQIAALDRAARARAAAIEEEAEARRAEREAQDRALWARTERDGSEAAIRRYLERFPDGIFADRARTLLGTIEDRRQGDAEATDRRDWQRALDAGTVDAYQRYLALRPGGAFAQEAEARVRTLQAEAAQDQAAAQARAEEDGLNLNPIARSLAETRLRQLGLEPGPADGRFDDATRRAIRSFQRDRGLTASGYLDQDTVVRLLADGILGR